MNYNTNDWWNTIVIEKAYDELICSLRRFTNKTNRNNEKDSKRTINYLKWNSLKTDIINSENEFVLPNNVEDIVKRCNVIWVHFGFNIGSEFGGHHPAIVVRKMGNAVYVIPLDSGTIPEEKKDKGYLIPIRYVYNFPNIPRHCNIYNMIKIDYRRIDFSQNVGSISGKTMTQISKALKKYVIY